MADLDLSRTEEALAAYDVYVSSFDARMGSLLDECGNTEEVNARVLALFDELDEMARAVGHAFGIDTSDRNSVDTCRACVRPGPWLRELVARSRGTP